MGLPFPDRATIHHPSGSVKALISRHLPRSARRSVEVPPALEDVGLGDHQLAAFHPVLERDRPAPSPAGVGLGEAEGLVALVADHPLALVAEAPLALGAGLVGVEGD